MLVLVERLAAVQTNYAALGIRNADFSATVACERRDREVGGFSEIDGQGFPAR